MIEINHKLFTPKVTLADGSMLEQWPNPPSVKIQGNKLIIEVYTPFPCKSFHKEISSQILNQWHEQGGNEAEINIIHQVPTGIKPVSGLESIKNIIAVASAKGGVGKSTTALNMALILQAEGAKVGLLDADIYGPSLSQVVTERPTQDKGHADLAPKLNPVPYLGIETMSIGFLLSSEDSPLVWRGPVASRALMQILCDTTWSQLDYLVVDLPPGTGDIQLTLAQKIPISGTVIVTTAHGLSLMDAKKGIKMFQKVHVPILGILENMSYYKCQHCGDKNYLFGQAGGKQLAEQFNVPFLGEIPYHEKLMSAFDRKSLNIFENSETEIVKIYRDISYRITSLLAKQALKTKKFPKIVIEK